MIIDTLIIDRTQEDVDEWARLRDLGTDGMTDEERAVWDAGMKGAYKASDFNRVSEAHNYLADILRHYGAISRYTELKTDWETGDKPLAEDLSNFLGAIRRLKSATNAGGDMPESFRGWTFQTANDLEQLLININEKSKKIETSLIFSGDNYAGEA